MSSTSPEDTPSSLQNHLHHHNSNSNSNNQIDPTLRYHIDPHDNNDFLDPSSTSPSYPHSDSNSNRPGVRRRDSESGIGGGGNPMGSLSGNANGGSGNGIGEPPRKRVKLACQLCQKKRTKCDGAQPTCGACESASLDCSYVQTGLKRGPPKGYKPKKQSSSSSPSTIPPQPQPRPPSASTPTISSWDHLLNRTPTHGPNLVLSPTTSGHMNSPGGVPAAGLTLAAASGSGAGLGSGPGSGPQGYKGLDGNAPNYGQGSSSGAGSSVRGYAGPTIGDVQAHSLTLYHQLDSQEKDRSATTAGKQPATDNTAGERDGRGGRKSTGGGGVGVGGGGGSGGGQQQTRLPGTASLRQSLGVGMALGGGTNAGGIGLSAGAQDFLLNIYFTHVHNVWPLLYKPMFLPAYCHPSLLLSIFSVSSVVSVPYQHPDINPHTLFQQAREAIHRASSGPDGAKRSTVYLVQALCLMSLRQTRMGDKPSAYLYSGQACTMALELGLHKAGTGGVNKKTNLADEETRSRVYWCCYIIDKALAEETGRPVLLCARRSTTPLPSTTEADEYELWPPPADRSTRPEAYANPIQARTISAFNATCKLGVLVEKILDLDEEGPRFGRATNGGGTSAEDELYQNRSTERALSEKDVLAGELTAWYQALPENLKVDVQSSTYPPTHLVVNLAWYHSAVILLHSRFISLRPNTTGQTGLYGECHLLCARSAEAIVQLIQCLERNRLLVQISPDVIHMLSQAALFHAYNSSLPDVGMANTAKLNFSQCCLWLRDLSKSWAPASSHRVFFEGLIQGGLVLSESLPEGEAAPAQSQHAPQPQPTKQSAPREQRPSLVQSQASQGSMTLMPALERTTPVTTPHGSHMQLSPSARSFTHPSPQQEVAKSPFMQGPSLPVTATNPSFPNTIQPAPNRVEPDVNQMPWSTDLFQLPSVYWNQALPTTSLDAGANMGQDFDQWGLGLAPFSDPFVGAAGLPLGGESAPQPDQSAAGAGTMGTGEQDSDATNFLVSWMLEAAGKQAR